MLDKFRNFILKERLFDEKDKILLAVSGGLDSVAMTHLFKSAGFEFGIAHCNFKLRGTASDEDEIFVKQLAKNLNVKFHHTSFETEKIAEDLKISIQVAARDLRYSWFKKIQKQFNYKAIATAHHQNDSIETVLYNFTKGCGIRGLHGIHPKKGAIIRPLLFAGRNEIEQFVELENIAYREDASNASVKYMRNKIRHEVIPVLNSVNPSFEKTAIETIKRLNETEAIFNWAIEQFRNEVMEVRGNLIYINFDLLPEQGKATVLYELIKPFGFNEDQCRQILFDNHAQSGASFHTENYRLTIDRSYFVIDKIEEAELDCFLVTLETRQVEVSDKTFAFNTLDSSPSPVSKEKHIAELDFDKLHFPLKLRKWQAGDFFQPLGMEGKKQKLQDFFTHQKLSIPQKEKVWILESQGKICWVAGLRIDERFKITDQTKKCYRVEIKTR